METVVFCLSKFCFDWKLVCLLYELKKQASQKKTDACSFYRERIFYFNRANASLMRRIASIIFSSEVA